MIIPTAPYLPIINILRTYLPSFYLEPRAVSPVALQLSDGRDGAIKKGEPKPSLSRRSSQNHLIGAGHSCYLSSHNDAIVRMDLLDLAIAIALVRFHFDKFRSLEPMVQAHTQAKKLFFFHFVDFKSVKVFRVL